jgi:hypothetical protein
LALKAKATEVSNAKERVARCAREVVARSGVVARLMDGLEAMQAKVIERRVALRFILFHGVNGELAKSDYERIENLFRQDRYERANNTTILQLGSCGSRKDDAQDDRFRHPRRNGLPLGGKRRIPRIDRRNDEGAPRPA